MNIFKICLQFSLAVFLAFVPEVSYSERAPITIGYLTDLSGRGATLGLQSRAGAELAVRELKKEGVPVSITFEDHRTDPKLALTGAKKLLVLDRADAIISDLSQPSIAASPVVLASKRLFLYQSPIKSVLASNPYAFGGYVDYFTGCHAVAEYWRKKGITKVGHFKMNSEFGELCLEGSRKVFPDEVVVAYDAGDDLRSSVTRMKGLGVQAILQSGFEGDLVERVRSAKDIGFKVTFGFPQIWFTENVQKTLGNSLEQSIVYGFPQISEDFINRLKAEKLFETLVSIESAAIAHLYVKLAVKAIESCPAYDIQCQVDEVERANPDSTLGFKGWDGHFGNYGMVLREIRSSELHDVEEVP